MHLVEQYALACGAKIDKPYIYEKFAPLPFNNYITFSPFSKPAKNYDYWREVLFMLFIVVLSYFIYLKSKNEAKVKIAN